MFLVACIDHALTRGINWLTTSLVERAHGFSSTEAGDFLDDRGGQFPDWYRYADALAEREAEQEVAESADEVAAQLRARLLAEALKLDPFLAAMADVETDAAPGWRDLAHLRTPIDIRDVKVGDRWCGQCGANITAVGFHACPMVADPQTPAAGQRGENPAGVTPPTPAGSPDPSPTIASRQHQPSVDGEGSPTDSDIPPSPAGERPNWRTWATPAICDVLAAHAFWPANHSSIGSEGHCLCGGRPHGLMEWREHVAPLIAKRLDLAAKSQVPQMVETGYDMGARIDGASEFFPQHRTTQK